MHLVDIPVTVELNSSIDGLAFVTLLPPTVMTFVFTAHWEKNLNMNLKPLMLQNRVVAWVKSP